MTSTPSNVAALHKTAEEDRHHDIHPSASPHTSDAELHRLGHSSRHASHTNSHNPQREVTHSENHREVNHSESNREAHPTFAEKFQGIKEELQGKLTHNPDLVKHGKSLLKGDINNKGGHSPHDQASANRKVEEEVRRDLTENAA